MASKTAMERIMEASRVRAQRYGSDEEFRDIRLIDLWGEGHWFGGLEKSRINNEGILCCNLILFWARLVTD
ncbi:hypothetical protein M422DRAFT_35119 [Sphaerobolus stellatus SS14]|uniref:Uncharacterized protein n=1 Tax=Sphaerobolus stellatus (strain SS14) TaxID=990650 RepID=A0A0C9TV71_SPHS4|nr:hypothetical protein M422DRAFT_35119 [Sphaerobolus stellatus SS14]